MNPPPKPQNDELAREPVSSTVWTSSTLSAALAAIVVFEIAGLGIYGYYRVQYALEPENLADRVETALRENYPQVREELVTEVKLRAPKIAEQASRELRATAPDARQWLERATRRQMDRGLDQVTELSADQFRAILQKNRDTVEAAFEKVEAAPEEARKLVLETEASMEEQLGIDLQRQAKQALAVHQDLNDKLAILTDPGATLTSRELLERRIARILKTMQQQEFPSQSDTQVSQTRGIYR